MIFLQELTAFAEANPDLGMAAALGLFVGVFLWLMILLSLGVYIYTSFAFMAIARKARYPSPTVAWIPAIGPAIIAWKTSQMHWWPWLLIIGLFIPFLNLVAMIILAV